MVKLSRLEMNRAYADLLKRYFNASPAQRPALLGKLQHNSADRAQQLKRQPATRKR